MSVTLIDNTKPLSSKWIYQPVPDFAKFKHPEVKKLGYWDQETDRWMHGYAGLTPQHYFALQMCHYQVRKGVIIRPEWRDIDDEVYQHIYQAMCLKKMEMVFKRRRVGLTSIGAGVIPHWYARVHKGSIMRITSKDQPTLSALFNEKLLVTQDHFHHDMRGSYDSKEGGNLNKAGAKLGMNIAFPSFNDDNEPIIKVSSVACRETTESDDAASKLSGSGIDYVFIDEAALHKRLVTLIGSLMPAMEEGFEMEGFVLIGGSMEDTIKQKELLQLQLLKDNPKAFNLQWMFVPGYMGMKGYTTNGHSDIQGATEAILRRREELDKLPDKKMYRAYVKAYPLTIDELFDLGGIGFWEESSIDILNTRKNDLSKKNVPISPVRMVRMGSELRMNVVNESPLHILEYAKPGVKYMIGMDSVGEGKEKGKKDEDINKKKSQIGVCVRKELDTDDYDPEKTKPGEETSYTTVAYYLGLPEKISDIYTIVEQLIEHYNQYGTYESRNVRVMPESNMASSNHFYSHMEALGKELFLMRRQDLSGKGNTNTNRFGTYMTPDVYDWARKQSNIVIQKYGYRERILKVVTELLLMGAENTDLGSSWVQTVIGMGNKFDIPKPPPPPPPPQWKRSIVNGRYEWTAIQPRASFSDEPKQQEYIEFMGIKTPINRNRP